jgi:Ca2+-transporting ATPase
MIETAIALAVAAVPEGLPMVATLALARGMWRMARRNALIQRLSAVETLGATTVIMTDKTGTLTENRMTVVQITLPTCDVSVAAAVARDDPVFVSNGAQLDPAEDAVLRPFLEVCVLCNNAVLTAAEGPGANAAAVGDPMEAALLVLGAKAKIFREDLLKIHPELQEEAFDPELKMMATVHQAQIGYRVAVKGAPEALLRRASHVETLKGPAVLSDAERAQWHKKSDDLAERGLRVLAIASKVSDGLGDPVYKDLTLLGLVGIHDPPREDVAAAITACKHAGIRVVMVTGDHAVTAQQIASAVGLVDRAGRRPIEGTDLTSTHAPNEIERQGLLQTSVFARVSPKQKLDLISVYQDAGAVVAMVGDGVNDAPALRSADIGIAMGQRGSQVAREASDLVLRDDAFGTIVAAVAQGRVIFSNIRKFIVYLLSCNLSEIMVVGLASLAGLPLPILPLQILYLNLITDVFPAFALGAGEGEADVMERKPRDPKEPFLTRQHFVAIGVFGAIIAATTLGAFSSAILLLGMDAKRAVTIAFLTLALSQLWHVFNMRDAGTGLVINEVTRNRYVWAALLLCLGLILCAVYVPQLANILGLTPPSARGLWLAVSVSFIPWVLGQLAKSVQKRKTSVGQSDL